MAEFFKPLIDYVSARWHRKSTILIFLFLITAGLLTYFSALDLAKITGPELAILVVVLVTAASFWYFTNRVPAAGKGKIGIAVAIGTEDVDQQKQLQRDFVQTLRALLGQSSLRYHFSLVELPSHIVERINDRDTAELYRRKARCHFMIYGDVRTRRFQGENKQFLSMEGIVSHRPLPKAVSASLSSEFAELFPRKVIISSEGDIFQFEFTAEWVSIVAKYIIGTAALLSGDIPYASELFEDVYASTHELKTELPPLLKVKQRVPRRLTDINLLFAQTHYKEWARTKNNEALKRMEPFLKKLSLYGPTNPDFAFLASAWLFITARDTKRARAKIEKSHRQDAAWRYNQAFLLAYDGNMKRAIKEYRLAFKGYSTNPNLLSEIQEFIYWILEVEPDKVQFYFCLGLINHFASHDESRALQELEKFLELAPAGKYHEELALASTYIRNINRDIKKKEA